LLVRDSVYLLTTHFDGQLKSNGLSDKGIEQVELSWSAYPTEVDIDEERLMRARKIIQNDNHDQQSPGSRSQDMYDQGCVLVKGCEPAKHLAFEVKVVDDPYSVKDNDNDLPIRMVLSSCSFRGDSMGIPDGKSDCSLCQLGCSECKSHAKAAAYVRDAKPVEVSDYPHVHRDPEIIAAMRRYMQIQ
jgi:alpha-amylase